MQNNPRTTDHGAEQMAKLPKMNRKLGCIGLIVVCITLYLIIQSLNGRIPLSTLPVKEIPALDLQQTCGDSALLWPPTGENPNPRFPAYSPNGKWYIIVGSAYYRSARELRLYDAKSNRMLGNYSYFRLIIYCWAKDSSGIYLVDSIPGSGGLDIFSTPGWESPPKKILTPCQGDLQGASIWIKAYWGIRCQFEK